MKNYTVYMHIAPNGKKYIGITSMKPKRRWDCGRGYSNNEYFTRAIIKYGWDNFQHIILFEGLSEKEAKQKEIELIKKHMTNTRKYGFNISSGGESHSGATMSEKARKIISEANKNKIVSEITRKKLSEATKKRFSSPEARKEHGKYEIGEKNHRYGIKLTDKEKLIRGAKPVLQLTISGDFVQKFISLHEASNKTNIARCSISDCCKGKIKQAGGYVWKYE